VATLGWDPNRWRWIDQGRFLNYTTKDGRESIINRNPCTTHATYKWQGYSLSNYRFHWSQVWDLLRSGKETAFMWSIWHKVVDVDEWRVYIAPASISKQCVFYLLNTSESVKHKLWDCIQARRAWRWATFIMHELYKVRTGNYNSFDWKQALFGDMVSNKYEKCVKFGTSLGVLHFGPFGLNVMTKCSIINTGTSLRSSKGFGTNSLFTPKRLGIGWLNKSRLATSPQWPYSKALTKLGVLGTFFVEGTIYILSGIGKGNIDRRSSPLFWGWSWWFGGFPWLVGWGWSLARWV
jgi:hypothetical protein